jgi:hypothetical protein
MKSALILEDTPNGLKAKLVWQSSDYLDNVQESIAMHLMAFTVRHIEQLEQSGALRVLREGPGDKTSQAI